ncbi:MAG: ATP synthase F1 subunit delta [Crocinitomicaceae bacterium]|jgi:F-type H+-transporting ATPase subunit delta|nr:ATP synthase F1 subunit delta [Crocinitomicaceae bacterium]|tara:strand:+ start:1081 stop:1617 length:537 start_codon:yes stop_codon:yes gene_type:complete
MKGTKSAIRYAKALIELADENGSLNEVSNDITQLKLVCDENRDLVAFLNSPIIDRHKKISILEEAFSSFNEVSTKFMRLITKNKRENILPAIADSFVRLLQEKKGIVPVKITASYPISEETKNDIISKLPQDKGITYDVSVDINKALIGGFIVRMGDKQIDASISGRLNNLKLAFNAQ